MPASGKVIPVIHDTKPCDGILTNRQKTWLSCATNDIKTENPVIFRYKFFFVILITAVETFIVFQTFLSFEISLLGNESFLKIFNYCTCIDKLKVSPYPFFSV